MKRLSLKNCLAIVVLFIFTTTHISWTFKDSAKPAKKSFQLFFKPYLPKESATTLAKAEYAYDSLQLDLKGLSKNAFEYAVEGFEDLKEEGLIQNDSILTIVDFDQPSYSKRMYVLDVKNFKVLFNTWVAHGKNSGQEWAQSFSNTNQSNKSSLGFYLTAETYNGSKGFSLKLKGLEKSLNDNALQRGIVIHGANYVSQSAIDGMGYIGRSHGCPAVPVELNKPIINKIKSGSCFFIYNSSYKSSFSLHLS